MLIPKFDLYKTEWLDLVFQNRNKAYGAYELRKHHGSDTAKALSITLSSLVAAAIVVTIISHHKPLDNDITVMQVDNSHMILPPKVDKPLQAKPAKPKPAAPLTHHNTVVIPTHITTAPVTTEPPTQVQLQTSVIGTTPDKGDNGTINAPIDSKPGGTGDGGPAVDVPADAGGPLLTAEVNPEPIGGMQAWAKFLQRNMRYPDTEVQGRVFLSFIVERDGSLTDIKVIKGVSPELDNEALRVLKMAPKWKPGLQAGKPVRVQFNIPINFQLNN